nr:hypothetical protein [Deinococcus sp. RM]
MTSDYNTAFFLKQQGNSLSGVMHMDLMSFITAVGPQSVKGSLKNGKVTLVVGPGQGMPCQGTVAGSTMRLACQLGGRTVNFTMNRSTQKAIENKVAEAKTKSLNMRAAVEKGVRLSALFSEMKSISQRTLDAQYPTLSGDFVWDATNRWIKSHRRDDSRLNDRTSSRKPIFTTLQARRPCAFFGQSNVIPTSTHHV